MHVQLFFVFGPNMKKLTGDWRKLRIEDLHFLYASQKITRIIISKRMRWAVRVALMGDM
jgi:hypothetical protein